MPVTGISDKMRFSRVFSWVLLMRRFLAFLIAFCVLASGVWAVEGSNSPAPKKKLLPNQVEMPFLIAPVNRNGDLIGFQYISSLLVASSPQAAEQVRLKLAYVQDGLVREAYRAPVGTADDQTVVDQAALGERLTAVAKRIAGEKNVVKIIFTNILYAPVHPRPNGAVQQPNAGAGNSGAHGPENSQKSGAKAATPEAGGPATSQH
jgi:hypothetical protein